MNLLKKYKHGWLLLYFAFYAPAFFLLEHFMIPKYIIECPLDNMIPFCEWFIFPYYLWYLTMPGSLIFLMFTDKEAFYRLCFIMFTGMTVALGVYWIAPNGLNLRVDIPGDNFAQKMCIFLQGIDTPTNVNPSIHVSSSLAIDMAIQKSDFFKNKRKLRMWSFVVMVFVSISTVFVKQHSVWDVVTGAVMSVLLMLIYDKILMRTEQTVKKEAAEKALTF